MNHPQFPTYAPDTSVSVEKSRSELDSLLSRYGAKRFGSMTEERSAIIVFTIRDKNVKFVLPLPDRTDQKFATRLLRGRRVAVHPTDAYRAWEQECRSKWRSLLLCVKAKLEAVSAGITTFEAEFLAHFELPNGATIGELMLPKLEQCMTSGKMPLLLNSSSES